MDPYSISYSNQAPPLEPGHPRRQPAHGYQPVAQQPGYMYGQAPAPFSAAGNRSYEDGGYYTGGYQNQLPVHQTFQGGGLVRSEYSAHSYQHRDGGKTTSIYDGRYGATDYVSASGNHYA